MKRTAAMIRGLYIVSMVMVGSDEIYLTSFSEIMQ